MSLEGADLIPALEVPELHGTDRRGGGDQLAIRAELRRPNFSPPPFSVAISRPEGISQTRTVPSSEAVTAAHRAGQCGRSHAVPMRLQHVHPRPSTLSQSPAVSSWEAVMISRPLGSNCAIRTVASCPSSTETMRLLPACQSRAVRSYEAVTTLAPSGLNAAHNTAPSWPCSTSRCCPLAVPRAARCDPKSGHHLGPVRLMLATSLASWPYSTASSCARSVPEPRCAMIRGGHQLCPVRAEDRATIPRS